MTAPAGPWGVRNKKRTPARPTAHVGYQPAGLDYFGHRVKATYHAITDQAVRVGSITRRPGAALCGCAGPWAPVPDGLFPPLLSCRACQRITTNQHITIAGGTS